jgi:hypothetical protein
MPDWRPPLLPRASEDVAAYIGRVHGIEAIEFPDRPERRLLVCAGTGLMLSLMDQLPRVRWCIDCDGLRPDQREAMPGWLAALGNVMDQIVVAGWYCSTNPEPLARAVRPLARERVAVYVQCRGVGGDPFADLRTADNLDQLIEQAR